MSERTIFVLPILTNLFIIENRMGVEVYGYVFKILKILSLLIFLHIIRAKLDLMTVLRNLLSNSGSVMFSALPPSLPLLFFLPRSTTLLPCLLHAPLSLPLLSLPLSLLPLPHHPLCVFLSPSPSLSLPPSQSLPPSFPPFLPPSLPIPLHPLCVFLSPYPPLSPSLSISPSLSLSPPSLPPSPFLTILVILFIVAPTKESESETIDWKFGECECGEAAVYTDFPSHQVSSLSWRKR